LAQTCFPNDGLNGGIGHDGIDVLCKSLGRREYLSARTLMQWFTDIVFGNEVPSGVGDETINISALKSLGDTAAKKLAAALGV
jgi:chitosanase